MRDADEAIDRVLAGLRDAEAPAGMERRIAERMERMQQEGAEERVRRSIFRDDMFVWPAATALTVVAAVVVVFMMMPEIRMSMHRPPPLQIYDRDPADLPMARPQPETATTTNEHPRRLVSSMKPKAAPANEAAKKAAPEAMSGSDALALSELHAPSHPAPPLPLTEQERLLLRVANTAGPDEVAAMSPARRAKEYEEERAEVHRFFVPGKTGDDE